MDGFHLLPRTAWSLLGRNGMDTQAREWPGMADAGPFNAVFHCAFGEALFAEQMCQELDCLEAEDQRTHAIY
jgi:hypothetical protein